MAQPQHTHSLPYLEEALTVLFCLIDEAYALLNPHGAQRYECGRGGRSNRSGFCGTGW